MINLRRLVIYAVAVGPVESLSPFCFLFLVGYTSRSGHRVAPAGALYHVIPFETCLKITCIIFI